MVGSGAAPGTAHDYFPRTYQGSRDDVRLVLQRICTHMGIEVDRIDLDHDEVDADPLLSATSGCATGVAW